jgi:uncharacterized protein
MDISIDKAFAVDDLRRILIKNALASAKEVELAMEDSYDRLLKPSIENEFRLISKTQADDEADQVFAENLRQLSAFFSFRFEAGACTRSGFPHRLQARLP